MYTTAMRAELRNRRRAEIESDMWESLHDEEHTRRSGVHIIIRLICGIPDDLSWRVEQTMSGGQHMWRRVAFLSAAAAAVTAFVWISAFRSDMQSLPTLPDSPTPNYVERRRVPPPPPPHPTWEQFVAKVNGRARK